MKQLWDADELSQHWSLTYEELELLKTKPERLNAMQVPPSGCNIKKRPLSVVLYLRSFILSTKITGICNLGKTLIKVLVAVLRIILAC
jgi:hypothetical protein